MDQQPPLVLKDIHLPDAIGWWPPAIGWWLLLLLIPLAIWLCWWLYRRLTRPNPLKAARQLLQQIEQNAQQDPLQTLQQLSAWLRRVAITIAPREQSAGLSGQAWLQHLEQSLPDKPFSEGPGRCLADAPFRQTVDKNIELSAVIELCKQWLKVQKVQQT